MAKKSLDAKYFREAIEILMPQLLVTGSLVSTHPLPGNSQAVLTLLQNRSETHKKTSAAKKSSEQGIPGWGLPRRRGIGRTKYAMRCCSRAREVGDPGGCTGADAQAAGSGQYIQCPAKHWT